MRKAIEVKANQKTVILGLVCLTTLVAVEPAFAAGGLSKVNSFVQQIQTILQGVAIGVVTIAIMWAGYRWLWKNAAIEEIGKILGGSLLIGGAAELASFLIN